MMKIIESPREGMQGFSRIIATGEKVRYIGQLLRAGFDTVEIGSLVSPKALPQMADSLDVLDKLDLTGISSNRMFLAATARGAEKLAESGKITHISYPFSFSPAFLKMNLNTTLPQSMETAEYIINRCHKTGKLPVIYISMAFGNPYGDPWNMEMLTEWVGRLHQAGANIIPLSNVSMEIDASLISTVYSTLVPLFPDVEFGMHLHTANRDWYDKVRAAYDAGCRRFDGVINGHGGCPMSGKEMLGNLKTENLLEFAEDRQIPHSIDNAAFSNALKAAEKLFSEKEFV